MEEKNTHTHFESKIPEEAREHFRTAREEFFKSMEGMIPPGFVEHRRNARKEMLLAWRSMIDATLAKIDVREAPVKKPATRKPA